jgi:hypothetical protein
VTESMPCKLDLLIFLFSNFMMSSSLCYSNDQDVRLGGQSQQADRRKKRG